ncbi:MAG TPA: hypothetical protein VFT68_04970 [Lapillicoccus sp.]|nr:hypothetical protein [Lapillicoccus sp.]
MKNSTSPAGRRPPIGAAGRVLLVAAVAAAAVTGLGVGAASASASDPSAYSVEAFRETIKPWDSITIPALACPTGYLQDVHLAPGRIVPKGVEVLEPNAIGVTISEVTSTLVTDWWNRAHYPVTGTTTKGGPSTATNWDPFSSHELVIRLHCTTDLSKAFKDPSPYS